MSLQTVHIQNLLHHLTPSLARAQQDVKATREADGSANLQSTSPTPLITFLEDLTRSRIPYLRRGDDGETEEGKAWNWKVVVGWWAWEVGVLGSEEQSFEAGLSNLKEKFEERKDRKERKEKKRERKQEQKPEPAKMSSPPPVPPRVQSLNRNRSSSHASVVSSSELDDQAFISAVERKVNELAQKVEMCKSWLHQGEAVDTPEEITNAIRREAPTSPERPPSAGSLSPLASQPKRTQNAEPMSPLLDQRALFGSSPEASRQSSRAPSRASMGLSRMPDFNFGDELDRSRRTQEEVEENRVPDEQEEDKDAQEDDAQSDTSSPLEVFAETSTPRARSPALSMNSSTTEGMNEYEHSEELSFSFSLAAAQERLRNQQAELGRFREVEQRFGLGSLNDLPDPSDISINRPLFPVAPLSQIDEESGEYSTHDFSIQGRVQELPSVEESEAETETETEGSVTETEELAGPSSSRPEQVRSLDDFPDPADFTIHRSTTSALVSPPMNEQSTADETQDLPVDRHIERDESEFESESESEEDISRVSDTRELPIQAAPQEVSSTPAKETQPEESAEEISEYEDETTNGALENGAIVVSVAANDSVQDPDWSAFVHSTLPPPRPTSPRKTDIFSTPAEAMTSNSIFQTESTSIPQPVFPNATTSSVDQNPYFSSFLDSISPPRSTRSSPSPRNIPVTPVQQTRTASSTPGPLPEAWNPPSRSLLATPAQAFRTAQSTPAPPHSITVTRVRTRADSFPDIMSVGDTIDLERMRAELEEIATPRHPIAEKHSDIDGDDEDDSSDPESAESESESDGEIGESVANSSPNHTNTNLEDPQEASAKPDQVAESQTQLLALRPTDPDDSLDLAASTGMFSPKPSEDNALVPFLQGGPAHADETVPELDPPPFSTRRMPNLFPAPAAEEAKSDDEGDSDSGADVTSLLPEETAVSQN